MTSRSTHAREIYEAHVRSLPRDVQLQLVAVIAGEAADAPTGSAAVRFADLSGLGAEVWEGVDPADYVQQLRSEWAGRP